MEADNMQQTSYKLDHELQRFLALQSRYCIEELPDKVNTFFFFPLLSPLSSFTQQPNQPNSCCSWGSTPLPSHSSLSIHPSMHLFRPSSSPDQLTKVFHFFLPVQQNKLSSLRDPIHTRAVTPKAKHKKARRVNWDCRSKNTGIIKLAAPLNETSS